MCADTGLFGAVSDNVCEVAIYRKVQVQVEDVATIHLKHLVTNQRIVSQGDLQRRAENSENNSSDKLYRR